MEILETTILYPLTLVDRFNSRHFSHLLVKIPAITNSKLKEYEYYSNASGIEPGILAFLDSQARVLPGRLRDQGQVL